MDAALRLPIRRFLSAVASSKLPVADAISIIKKSAGANFDETVEIAVHLGVDPRKPNQSIRGATVLPNGTGKKVRVAAFVKDDDIEKARAAGADIIGDDDLVKKVQKGIIDFDRCIATPDSISILRPAARILGPRGLMPNAKVGTLTSDVASGIKAMKAGQVNYRAEKNGIIHAGIGKASFTDKALLENIQAFMMAILNAKPEGQKGKYIKAAHMCSTMGKGFELDVKTIDPSSAHFMKMGK